MASSHQRLPDQKPPVALHSRNSPEAVSLYSSLEPVVVPVEHSSVVSSLPYL